MTAVDVDTVAASVMVGAGALAFVVALAALALAAWRDRRDARRARAARAARPDARRLERQPRHR